jgi:hypothetical protein
MDCRILRAVQGRYAQAPLRDRIHVTARLALCPFRRLATFAPSAGLIVDLGCRHGHLGHALAMELPPRGAVVRVRP